MKKTLSQPALDVVKAYEALQFGDQHVCTPYFNNKRQKVRGALRVLVGKGTPSEIIEEAFLFSHREHIDLRQLSAEGLKTYLVDHNLGIDCSGLMYHVLDAEIRERTHKPLKSFLTFPNKSLFRKILATLRPAENTNVKTFADEKNSNDITLSEIQPGDIITFIGSKKVGNPDHILLIESVDDTILSYVHAYTFPSDGTYGHGVKRGNIEITDAKMQIKDQRWDDAEMCSVVRDAKEMNVKRLYSMSYVSKKNNTQ
ncbi:MAG: hypothetical protein COV60_01575 [Candidatus Magasanikbacteria bacterium CG11_big_fil_rev_8_21_14_0_20_43_7]|uniref:Uncharacterized protein n=1 Tax=Candidatus Magasanikbacteria bacterium CG11_big_fil_rev_8_21_14_0_20_43_7 TaxID=1974654 RepID=A0A2H0N2U0_9BACT|nr:MAG: hypothetical protein COV60_01575 [Candidatus Magasanikbacteria bacterium CG11_big_fil_rev_8_21_14_0_20_43_7]